MYQKILGSLIYLTLTRPDISFIVGVLSRFMQNPRKPHLEVVHRVLKYIKSTLNNGILFKADKYFMLRSYCDADYAGDFDTRRSTTWYIFMLGQIPISRISKRQPTVSLSTKEVEYRAATMAAHECVWLKQLLENLNQEVNYNIPLYCNNLSTIHLAQNPTLHAITKHIEVQYHFIRERYIKEKLIWDMLKLQINLQTISQRAYLDWS